MTDITLPQLSDSMEEGTILRWLHADGDEVALGDELVEIETDKATMTHEAVAAGVLAIVAAEGDTLPVGAVIARIGAAGEPAAPAAAAPAASVAPATASSAPHAPPPTAPPTASSAPGERPAAAVANGGEVRASPIARRLAARHAIALDALTGTGPRGRIVRGDVEAAAGVAPAPAAPQPAAEGAATGAKGAVTRVELTRRQLVVARRMAETKATVPDFQVATEVDMGEAIALRAALKALPGERPAPSLNDFVIRACGLALRDHPRANGAYRDGAFERYERVNVGMAVAADDALVVPTVFDADTTSLGEIARTTRRLADAVRAGTITPPELAGGTFTVSNLGMFGMTSIAPIINGGQAAILGVGALREVLARRDGELVDRTLMTLTLTGDHRILYGADAARLLSRIRELLEAPLLLVL